MDSAKSGSLQTSSNGDDEYDSRAAAPDSFFSTTHQPVLHAASISSTTPPPPPLFDPLSHYNTLLNIPWPDPNPSFQIGPKKRSRASRREPTTVLTTDTSNFRAMVQEFTGIPAHPFDNTTRPRLDHLFGMRSIRRPFAQPAIITSNLHSFQNPLINSLLQFPFSNCDNQITSFQIQSNATQIALPNLISPHQNVENAETWRDDYEADQMKRIRYGGIMD